MADLINATDSLNTGRVKINAIIEDASAAVIAAESASATAGEAKTTANSVQTQLDTIILVNGASDAEVVQSRVDKDGKLYATLKERLDSSDAQLAEIVHLAPEPNGVDDTQNLRDFFALGYVNVKFRSGTYNITLDGTTNRQSLTWFTDKKNIKITGDGTIINDKTAYSSNKYVNVFGFTRCENVAIDGIDYTGIVVTNPDANLNTTGGTFAYFEDNCKNIKVNLKGTNLRYGVRSGDYLNPAYGQCKNFDLSVRGNMIGYPIAIYYGDNVKSYAEVDGFHRGTYLAGVFGGEIKSKCKNIYGEITHVLLTNTITEWNDDKDLRKTRACKNIDIFAEDDGSTRMSEFTQLIQLSLQWVSPGTEFENIFSEFYIKSSDGVSDKIGGFAIQSEAKSVRTEYPYNFEPHVKFINIKVKGFINRIGQTTATNSLGELFVRLYDVADTAYTHLPTVKNIEIEVNYLRGGVQSRTLYVDAPSAEIVTFKNCNLTGINLSGSAKKVIMENTQIANLNCYKSIDELNLLNSNIGSIDTTKIPLIAQATNQLYPFVRKSVIRRVNVTLSGTASVAVPAFFKQGALVRNIMGLITGYATTGTWTMGVPIENASFGNSSLNQSSGYNRFTPLNYPVNALPKLFNLNTDLVVTFNPTDGITFPTGTLQLYIEEEVYSVI